MELKKILREVKKHTNWDDEMIDNVFKFLQKQPLDDKISIPIFLIDKLYKHNKNIKIIFLFDDKIKTENYKVSCSLTHEQIFELGEISIESYVESLLIKEMVISILSVVNNNINTTIYISTDTKFFDSFYINYEGHVTFTYKCNCKVLDKKYIRKLKLEKLLN